MNIQSSQEEGRSLKRKNNNKKKKKEEKRVTEIATPDLTAKQEIFKKKVREFYEQNEFYKSKYIFNACFWILLYRIDSFNDFL